MNCTDYVYWEILGLPRRCGADREGGTARDIQDRGRRKGDERPARQLPENGTSRWVERKGEGGLGTEEERVGGGQTGDLLQSRLLGLLRDRQGGEYEKREGEGG